MKGPFFHANVFAVDPHNTAKKKNEKLQKKVGKLELALKRSRQAKVDTMRRGSGGS